VPRPQTARNCGSYSFDARIKILTEVHCSHQYLSSDPKKNLPRPLQRPQTTHKLQQIVSMDADISKTIKDRELGFYSHGRSASLLREYATTTLWRTQFLR